MVKIRDDLPKANDGSIDIKQWIERTCQNRPQEEKTLLYQAVLLNLENGGHQVTSVNETCLRQGLLTAETLASLEPDIATLAAATVYFPAQFADLKIETIQAHLGEEIAALVEGVIQITTHSSHAKGETLTQMDNLRRMLLAVVEDVRVVLIKLAERITTLRAANDLPDEVRTEYALETRDIYAPLANRLGIGQIKWELEDFAFRYLEPQAYKNIAKLLDEKRLDREEYIKNVIDHIKTALAREGIQAEVYGRAKHIYSIWRKMIRKNLDFQDIYDVRAIRILVPEIRDCYAALGIVHSLWQHVPKEFDDYIATPKENGYRSLHTAVIGPEGRTLEVQIRTVEMHQEAELGVAAHWLYKEGRKPDTQYQRKLNSLRQILDWSEQAQEESNEALLREALEDRVYVFTPDGEVVDLPQGATPLDFAYHIHTELGHRCRGAKINGSIVPLNSQLVSGQQVEILSTKEGGPSRDWLNPNLGYLKTARARSKVHSWFKRQARDENLVQGREIIEKEFKRIGLEVTGLHKILSKFGLKSLDDLYANLGGGDIRISQIVNALQKTEMATEPDDIPVLKEPSTQSSEITIQGVGNLLCHFGRCCKPLPGDRIIGYITLGRGVTIHRQDCINILGRPEDEQRLIQVHWGELRHNVYPVDVRIKAYDRQGLLRDITSILSNERINVIAVNTVTNKNNNIAELVLTLEISDLSGLMNILNKISQLPNILEAHRMQAENSKKH